MAQSSLFDISGEVALVTGGAQGLGKAMAEALAEFGANVVIMDTNVDLAHATAGLIEKLGVSCLALPGDVTSPADAASAVSRAVEEFGHVDVLVNNAGICRNVPAEEMSLEDWNKVIAVDLTGVFVCAQAAGRQMIRQRRGRIINIASMSGLVVNNPQPQIAYNAAKAGVIMVTKSLAAEWARFGITVNAIAPGYMRTALTESYLAKPETQQNWIEPTPLKRPGEPRDLAGAVVYLASRASSFTTGAVLVVDGGYTIW